MFDTLKLIYTQDEALELVGRYEKVYKEKIKELEEDIKWYEKEEDRLREENRKLKIDIGGVMGERDGKQMRIEELNERIRFLEQCLDNKEKVNKSLREELQRYKDMWDSGEF